MRAWTCMSRPAADAAAAEAREAVGISACGLHWEALEEDTSVAGLLAGKRGTTIRD